MTVLPAWAAPRPDGANMPRPGSAPGGGGEEPVEGEVDEGAAPGDSVWEVGLSLFPGYDTNPWQRDEDDPDRASSSLFGARFFFGAHTPRPDTLDLRLKSSFSMQQLNGANVPSRDPDIGNPPTALLGGAHVAADFFPAGPVGLRLAFSAQRLSAQPVMQGLLKTTQEELAGYVGGADAVALAGPSDLLRNRVSAYAALAHGQGDTGLDAEVGVRAALTTWDESAAGDPSLLDRNVVGLEASAAYRLGETDAVLADLSFARSTYPNLTPVPAPEVEEGVLNPFGVVGVPDPTSYPLRVRAGAAFAPMDDMAVTLLAGWGEGFYQDPLSRFAGVIAEARGTWRAGTATDLGVAYRRDFRDRPLTRLTIDELSGHFRVQRMHDLTFVTEVAVARVAHAPLEPVVLEDVTVDGVRGVSPYSDLERVDPTLVVRNQLEVHLTDLVTVGAQHDFERNGSDWVEITGLGTSGTRTPAFDRHRFLLLLTLHSRP